jgi:protoporphyrin/coproporphyrin ferrochelatase
MTPSLLPPRHPPVAIGRIGVLLVNLGSPDAPTKSAVRKYLKQFLSDRRVIELSPLLWQPILRGIILNVRPGKSAAKYASVWRADGQTAPLVRTTAAQASALQRRFTDRIVVDYAMRYGSPSIFSRLENLTEEKGCNRLLIVPMYPQYCAATTATVVDEVNRWLAARRWQPTLRFLPPYHDNPAYISALAHQITEHLRAMPWQPEIVLASFHGMPQESLNKGDPYHCHAQKTGRLLQEKMSWAKEAFRVTFQSRFGPKKWLQPYTDGTVEALARQGIKRLAIVCPGFAADCLETLEEIAIEVAGTFTRHGGENFTYIPCLNDSPAGVDLLESLVRTELGGWN